MSRVGLRAVSLPPLVALTGWLHTRAIGTRPAASPRSVHPFALAGMALGLTLYTYPAAFAAPLVFAAHYLSMAIFHRDMLRRAPLGHLIFWLAATLTALPLGLTLARLEEGYLRVQQTALPLGALRGGDLGPLLVATRDTLLMWMARGDPLWRYNVAGRPVFGPALAAIFVLGVGLCLWRALGNSARRGDQPVAPVLGQSYTLVILWLLIGLVPSAVTDSPPAFLRAAGALPATYLALALGLDFLCGLLAERIGASRRACDVALALLAALTGAFTVRAYFAVWAGNEEVQRVYRADLAQVAAYLETHLPPGGVAISTSEPHHLDRFIFDYTPHGGAAIHWFDGLNALVFPGESDPAWLFVTREPTPRGRLQRGYLDHARLIEERRFPNGALAFQLYEVPGGARALTTYPPPTDGGVWVADGLAFPPDDPEGRRTALSFPVAFGDVIQLVGYESEGAARPGRRLRLVLTWHVMRDVTSPEPWMIFAHLLNAEGDLVAGRDLLAVPASTWRAGDVFVQVQDVQLDEGVASGRYHLEIGLYSQADGARFPVMVGGEAVGDRVLLEPVQVEQP
jgi:hypothetical protein